MRLISKLIVPLVLFAAVAGAQTKPSADEQAANDALAERFAQQAQIILASRSVVPATLRQSAALLEEACQLNPAEPRFSRLLTEAYLQLGGDEGRDGATKALARYRALVPSDQTAQIRLIDLYASTIDKAETIKTYLDQLMASSTLPAPVKAHVAIMGARLASERGQDDVAKQLIDNAIALFPLDTEALQLRYDLMSDDAAPAERAAALLALLRANPAQPPVINALARICAEAGLVDPCLNWFQLSNTLSVRLGLAADYEAVTAYTAELVIADQLNTAAGNIKQLLDADPSDSIAAQLGVLVAMRSSDKQRIDTAADLAKTAVRNQLGVVSAALNGKKPTTQVSDAEIAADVKNMPADATDVKVAYTAGLTDLAWIDIYGRSAPADAQPALTALRQLLPADSPVLARLDGWSFLVGGKKDEANVKLSAVAERDPLAALGVVRINGLADQGAAKKLLNDNPAGLIGATLIEALRGRFGLMPPTTGASAVKTELDKFPRGWLDILDSSRTRSFYSLKAAPSKISYSFGEPILVTATITNVGTLDLTIASDGAIRPDLWFDVAVKGINNQMLSGVAFDRMGGKLLLKPKESVSQTVRIDQGALLKMMLGNPQIALPLYGSLLTNPSTQRNGVAPGPGGTREQFSSVIERAAAPMADQQVQASFTQLLRGNGDGRVRSIDLLGTLAGLARATKDPAAVAKSSEISDMIRKSTGDSVPAVRAQAMLMTAMLSDQDVRGGILRQMISDSNPAIRAWGLVGLQHAVNGADLKEQISPLASNDEDALVKSMAAAMIAVADLPPPTSQPATQPAAADAQAQ